MGGSWSQAETREAEGRDPGMAADNSRQHQQRQINLLDHIDAVQDEVSHRMDFIERELDGKTCGSFGSSFQLSLLSRVGNIEVCQRDFNNGEDDTCLCHWSLSP